MGGSKGGFAGVPARKQGRVLTRRRVQTVSALLPGTEQIVIQASEKIADAAARYLIQGAALMLGDFAYCRYLSCKIWLPDCFSLLFSSPSALDHIAAQITTALYTLADAAAVSPAAAEAVKDAAADATQNKNGGFFGPLASVFESVLKVRRTLFCSRQFTLPRLSALSLSYTLFCRC